MSDFALANPTPETFVSAKDQRRSTKKARKRAWIERCNASTARWDAFKARALEICREEDDRAPLVGLDGTRIGVGCAWAWAWANGRLLSLSTNYGGVERRFERMVGEPALRRFARAMLAELAGGWKRWDWEMRAALDALREVVPVRWGLLSETRDRAVDAFQQLASAGYICECATGQFADLPAGGMATRWIRGIESGEFDEATVLRLGGRLMRAVCELEVLEATVPEEAPF